MLVALSLAGSLDARKITHFHIEEDSHLITKHFIDNKWQTTGMSYNDSFYHELRMYKQIELCDEKCSLKHLVAPMIGVSDLKHTLTFRKTGRMLCTGTSPKRSVMVSWLKSLTRALECCGLVHCDLQPKNIGITANDTLYAFDFDMAFVSNEGKPQNMKCPMDSRQVGTDPYMSEFFEILKWPCIQMGHYKG